MITLIINKYDKNNKQNTKTFNYKSIKYIPTFLDKIYNYHKIILFVVVFIILIIIYLSLRLFKFFYNI